MNDKTEGALVKRLQEHARQELEQWGINEGHVVSMLAVDTIERLSGELQEARALVSENGKRRSIQVAELEEQLADRDAKIAALEKDAGRWRFLRDQEGSPTPEEFEATLDADMADAALAKLRDAP